MEWLALVIFVIACFQIPALMRFTLWALALGITLGVITVGTILVRGLM